MIKFCILLVVVHVVNIRAACDYGNIVRDLQTTHLSAIPNGYQFFQDRSTVIPRGRNVELYCDGGFVWDKNPNYGWGAAERNEDIGYLITIMCNSADEMIFQTKHSSLHQNDFWPAYNIICEESSAKFYAGKLDYCDYEGIRLGIIVKNIPIVSSEWCYNFDNSEMIFTHYILSKRSMVLGKQIEYNPSSITQTDLSPGAIIDPEDKIPPAIILEHDHTLFIPATKHLLSKIDYTYEKLISNSLYSSLHIDALKNKVHMLSWIPWWTPLKVGNWEAFEKILSRQLDKGSSYGVYAGKSHRASFPKEFVCNSETEMIYDFNGSKKHIPLFIWNYIIPRNEDDDTGEFVLLAVNSPFTDLTDNSLVICEDICDKISWLKPLQATRKSSPFGYMFCCKPEDVYDILDGFPMKNVSFAKSNLYRNYETNLHT